MRVSLLLTLLLSIAKDVVAGPSSGCGKSPSKLKNGMNAINSNGSSRQFILHLPKNYDNKKPHRVIFAFHPTGGTANGTARSYYGLLSRAGDSILVSPQGQSPTAAGGKATGLIGMMSKGMSGWWRTGGKYGSQDLEFVDKIVNAIDADLCVDTRLRFATGFSFGGVMSYSLACLRPDKFRAVSVQSGANFDAIIDGMAKQNKGKGKGGKNQGVRPPAGCKRTDSFSMSFMGVDPSTFLDQLLLGNKKPGLPMVCGKTAVPYIGFMGICDGWIQYGRRAKDDFVRNNGCKPKEAKRPAEGSKSRVQTKYDCKPDAPVIWTEFDGTHQPTREAEGDTWKFFSQFK